MANELRYQRHVINEVKAQGGWGKKWASDWNNGVPDLLLSHCDLGGLFAMECKMEKVQVTWGRRKLKVTELQRKNMREIIQSGGLAVLGVFVYYGPQRCDLAVLPWYTEHIQADHVYGLGDRGRLYRGEGLITTRKNRSFNTLSMVNTLKLLGDWQ